MKPLTHGRYWPVEWGNVDPYYVSPAGKPRLSAVGRCMAITRGPLDATLKERIVHPSRDFSDFVNQYFLTPQIYMRGEQDASILERLNGDEQDTAREMIFANLRSGRTHLIDATVLLNMRNAIPTLESMQVDEYDDYEQYTIARALYLLKAMPLEDFFSKALAGTEKGEEFLASAILADSYRFFPQDKASKIINVGLRRDHYNIRASAYNAAVALQYITSNGGRYTYELGTALWKKQMAAATQGAPPPMYYEQLQYYVGDDIYGKPTQFEQRLGELFDSAGRRMPIYTEIG